MLSSSANLGLFGESEYKMSNAEKRVFDEFNGNTDCISLDSQIKKITDRLASETSKSNIDKAYISALESEKMAKQRTFIANNCSQKIEKAKQIESALLLTKGAIESEESVLTKNFVEQKIYIGVGALVLLVGLYIIVKK